MFKNKKNKNKTKRDGGKGLFQYRSTEHPHCSLCQGKPRYSPRHGGTSPPRLPAPPPPPPPPRCARGPASGAVPTLHRPPRHEPATSGPSLPVRRARGAAPGAVSTLHRPPCHEPATSGPSQYVARAGRPQALYLPSLATALRARHV